MTNFVHLRVRSEYTLSSSVVRIPDLVKQSFDDQAECIALNDLNNMFGALKFSTAASRERVKPLLGADISIYDEHSLTEEYIGELTFLIQNRTGYRNLCQLLSLAYQQQGPELERQTRRIVGVDRQQLAEHAEGLIILSGGSEGYIGRCLSLNKSGLARQRVEGLLSCFKDRFYFSVERLRQNEQEQRHLDFCADLGQDLSVAIVASNNVQFIRPTDYDSHKIRVGIHKNLTVNSEELDDLYSREQYLKSPEQMADLFADIPQVVSNTVEVARRCNFFLVPVSTSYFPRFATPDHAPSVDYLREKSLAQLTLLAKKKNLIDAELSRYQDRLELELTTIINMGFADYFLIVDEFVNWARQNGVAVGPGRGSGPGSLVAYLLDITRIDPIKYDLLFERFLNPERVSMPDFDIDFDDQNRDRVIEHMADKYGQEKVSQIITFGRMAARAVVRDVGRVTGRPYGQVDRIAKLIPFGVDVTLDNALQSSEFAHEYQNEENQPLIDSAKEIEGLVRNPGRHAGGLVVAPQPLSEYCPLYYDEDDNALTHFDKDDLASVGLVKYDFLGLRILSTIRSTIEGLKADKKIDVDVDNIALDDQKALRLINEERTLGVFQLESSGMRELIRKLKPDSFDDIVALVALYRPGPMEANVHDDYCKRKHNKVSTTFYHPSLEEVLRPTHGVFIYQEQVMQAAQVMAGYSLGEADILRNAISKKDMTILAEQRPIFIKGCLAKKIKKDVAEEVFELLNHFGGYGFNKSHSVSYGLLAFQTAWLKSHYPEYFMAALMTHEPNHDNIARMVRDCREMNIDVLPPDVNKSEAYFRVESPKTIRYGLCRIKGVGSAAKEGESFIDIICAEREKNGDYVSFMDFLVRLPLQKCNAKTLTGLIGSGAFDPFATSTNRLMLIDAVNQRILEFAQARQHEIEHGQTSLFAGQSADNSSATGSRDYDYRPIRPDAEKILELEYEALNLYLGQTPVELLRRRCEQLKSLPRLNDLRRKNGRVWCLFEIRDVATARRNNGLTVSCDDEDSNQILFYYPDKAQGNERSPWQCKNQLVLAQLECRQSRPIILQLFTRTDIFAKMLSYLNIHVVQGDLRSTHAELKKLSSLLQQAHRGSAEIRFNYARADMMGSWRLAQKLSFDAKLHEGVRASTLLLFGGFGLTLPT